MSRPALAVSLLIALAFFPLLPSAASPQTALASIEGIVVRLGTPTRDCGFQIRMAESMNAL